MQNSLGFPRDRHLVDLGKSRDAGKKKDARKDYAERAGPRNKLGLFRRQRLCVSGSL